MTIKVTYIYSACVVIETPDIRILCDPWFTDGIYDGSWYLYPPVKDPIKLIGEVDVIWISHIHPDHYDPVFLRKYLGVYPGTRILISDFKQNFLQKKMIADGFEPVVMGNGISRTYNVGTTYLTGIPSESNSINDIDAALVVEYAITKIDEESPWDMINEKVYSVINMNDCQYNAEQIAIINKIVPNPDIALLGYASAGPYPQTYAMDEKTMRQKAGLKRQQFALRHTELRKALNPKCVIPFAGQYVLGGKLTHLNEFRGVPDAIEVPNAIVLEEGGFISTDDLKPSQVRREPYGNARTFLTSIENNPMDYEKFPEMEYPIKRLMAKAYKNAIAKSECEKEHWFCIKYRDEWFCMNAERSNVYSCWISSAPTGVRPRSEITIDERYLFGLLTGIYHWNNAEVGSQFFTNRVPDVYNQKAQAFLNFLHV